MLKKIMLISLFLGFLVGCGDKESSTVKVVGNTADEGREQVADSQAITAIYLPGGAGLDFGKKPVAVTESKWEDKKLFIYEFEFEDSMHETLDNAISEIMIERGYSRVEASDPRFIKYVYYQKGKDVINVSYSKSVREGFVKNTLLKIWWAK